ncbi:hypothetical protein [Bradyrhizobium sp. JYMT SZCCT0428]|uniref:hypothetical protein n=1 Tax=Bradyrhizobium sp. JYMT SZCCT0428 TaxID=2807673 RepID=UPI001BA7C0E8|nr:hypothetical protein [Bradyrhizobium sp. JYMT SZCCT0428]MBR1154600.1 hypothetical protein [Bradyrhizobium sp. JYMT SZCCT0428]
MTDYNDRTADALEAVARRLRDYAGAPDKTLHLTVKEAAFILGVTDGQMRKLCDKSRFNKDPGGFCVKKGCRRSVVFEPFIKIVPVGQLHRVK